MSRFGACSARISGDRHTHRHTRTHTHTQTHRTTTVTLAAHARRGLKMYNCAQNVPFPRAGHIIKNTRFTDGRGWTNEFHIYNLSEGNKQKKQHAAVSTSYHTLYRSLCIQHAQYNILHTMSGVCSVLPRLPSGFYPVGGKLPPQTPQLLPQTFKLPPC